MPSTILWRNEWLALGIHGLDLILNTEKLLNTVFDMEVDQAGEKITPRDLSLECGTGPPPLSLRVCVGWWGGCMSAYSLE